MPFTFSKTKLPDVTLIEPKVFKDSRGFFMECYKFSEFSSYGIKTNFLQDNISKSSEGVLRGLHYQDLPKGQAKLVKVLSGEIFDVAVDIRKNSPTYKQWVGIVLSDLNKKMLYIPEWCAHGFLVLSKEAIVSYKTTNEYAPDHEKGVLWNDPSIGIDWPTKVSYISEKDQLLPILSDI